MRIIKEMDLARFCQHLKVTEHEHSTISKYSRAIGDFMRWLNGRKVTKELVLEWKDQLCDQYSPVTVNGKLTALNVFFKYLGWYDCVVRTLRIQRKAFRDRNRELTKEEYDELVAAAKTSDKIRLMLIIESIGSTGIRVSELQFITVEAAQREKADISMKGKVRTILLPGDLCRKLLKYAKKKKITSGEIFITESGNSLARQQIWAEMKALCEVAGVEPSKVFPHNLRHLFARTFYRATHDIVKLADILGHSSIETTRLYLITTGEEHARLLNRLGLVS